MAQRRTRIEVAGPFVLVVMLGLFPGVARASDIEGARVVVILFEPHTEAVSQRLRQEVESLGFQVELKPETLPPASLETLGVEAGAIAAIHVEPLESGGVEMTVLDRATGKTVHRELARVSATDPASEELVATRTVELFRASLMELSADHPTRGDVRASRVVEGLVHRDQELQLRRRSGVISVAAGPALSLMPKWRPSAQLWVDGSWTSAMGIGLSAAVFSALSAARLTDAEGSVDLTATTYRLGVTWDSNADSKPFSGRLSVGWSLSTLSLRGNAGTPYVGLQADLVAWSPWLGASGRVRISNHVALVSQVTAALSLPRETIRFAGRDVGDFARPEYFVAFGPELSWP